MITLFFIITACQPSGTNQGASDDNIITEDIREQSSAADTTCYLYVNGRDSVHLHLYAAGDSLFGALHFDNYQIDGSQGKVAGRFLGDTLFLRYDFLAEGTHNSTEETFLKKGDALVRGFGDREESQGVYRFTNHEAIDFSEGQHFQPVPCPNN